MASHGSFSPTTPKALTPKNKVKKDSALFQFSRLHNIWTRNSNAGRILLVCLCLSLGLSEVVIGWSCDAQGSESNIAATLAYYSLDGVTQVDGAPIITLQLAGDVMFVSGVINGVFGILTCIVGVVAIARQGKNSFHILSLLCIALCVSGVCFSIYVIVVVATVIADKNNMQVLCDLQNTSAGQYYCTNGLSDSFNDAQFQLIGPAAFLGFFGVFHGWMAVLATFARLNAPPNLARLVVREAQEAAKLAQKRRIDLERQREQLKVHHAFRMLDAFQLVDINSDGRVDASELQAILAALHYDFTDKEVQEMVDAADEDGNGVLDYQEFIRMMMSGKHVALEKILQTTMG